eukprot:716525-Hanusia_phi.AAC.1
MDDANFMQGATYTIHLKRSYGEEEQGRKGRCKGRRRSKRRRSERMGAVSGDGGGVKDRGCGRDVGDEEGEVRKGRGWLTRMERW